MKSFVLGFSTLLALAAAPAAAQVQYEAPEAQGQYNAPAAMAQPAGPEYEQDGAYAPAPGPMPGQYQNAPMAAPMEGQYQNAPMGVPMQGQAAMPQAPASFGFAGPHPIPYDQGGGFCNQQGPHVHPYPVFDRNLFRESNGYA